MDQSLHQLDINAITKASESFEFYNQMDGKYPGITATLQRQLSGEPCCSRSVSHKTLQGRLL